MFFGICFSPVHVLARLQTLNNHPFPSQTMDLLGHKFKTKEVSIRVSEFNSQDVCSKTHKDTGNNPPFSTIPHHSEDSRLSETRFLM